MMRRPLEHVEQGILARLRVRPGCAGCIIGLLFMVATVAFAYLSHRLHQLDQQHQTDAVVRVMDERVNEMLTRAEMAAMTVSQHIVSDPYVADFDSIGKHVLQRFSFIDAVQVVPDGIIRQVYPLEENEAVVDYDIMQDERVNKEARTAIENKRMFFAGPLKLKQGGIGVVGRLPVYRNGHFWGFSAVVIHLETMIENLELDGSETAMGQLYRFQLGKVDPNTGKEQFFIPGTNGPNGNMHDMRLFPEAGWRLYVMPLEQGHGMYVVALILLIGAILAVVLGHLTNKLIGRGRELNEALDKLEWQHREMSDSITSASYLQRSVLHEVQDMERLFPESFVLFRPRDKVSGDFYWVHENGTSRFMIVVDCTGHGVSAALLSMVAVQALAHIVETDGEISPAVILERLDKVMVAKLQGGGQPSMDGLDISICRYDLDTGQLLVASAQQSVYMWRDAELKVLKADRRTVGGHRLSNTRFTEHVFHVEYGDVIYLTSDGFHSQFGGASGKKLGKPGLRSMLEDTAKRPFNRQQAYLEKRFDDWKGDQPQVDDVLVVGIRL